MNSINFISIFRQFLLVFYYLIKFHNYIYVVIFKFDNLILFVKLKSNVLAHILFVAY